MVKEKLGSNVVKEGGVMWWKERKWCGRGGSNVMEEEGVMWY